MLWLKEFFWNLFVPETRENELDKYLRYHDPQTTADVEYYIRKFDREAGGKAVWWGR
jgi:hypothetical protein